MNLLSEAMGQGYEGLILRTKDMPYPLANHRINELVKVKKIHDEEFPIVDCYQGRDKEAGLIVFRLALVHDPTKVFGARPCWSYETIGKMATVAFEDKSEYDVPINPRLIRLRDDI